MMNTNGRKKIIGLGVVAVVVSLALGVAVVVGRSQDTDKKTTEQQVGAPTSQVTRYDNFAELSRRGVSEKQIVFLKSVFDAYAFRLGNVDGFRVVGVAPGTIRIQSDKVLAFRVVVDEKERYLARLAHAPGDRLRLQLYNANGELKYDSYIVEPESS